MSSFVGAFIQLQHGNCTTVSAPQMTTARTCRFCMLDATPFSPSRWASCAACGELLEHPSLRSCLRSLLACDPPAAPTVGVQCHRPGASHRSARGRSAIDRPLAEIRRPPFADEAARHPDPRALQLGARGRGPGDPRAPASVPQARARIQSGPRPGAGARSAGGAIDQAGARNGEPDGSVGGRTPPEHPRRVCRVTPALAGGESSRAGRRARRRCEHDGSDAGGMRTRGRRWAHANCAPLRRREPRCHGAEDVFGNDVFRAAPSRTTQCCCAACFL